MATDYSILRSHLLAFIRRAIKDPHAQFETGILRTHFQQRDIDIDGDPLDWITVEQIIHEFYIEGILVPGPPIKPGSYGHANLLRFPIFHLTPYGETVLATTEYQPHDPDGYLQRLHADVPSVDPVIIRYLDECLTCFRRNLMLSAAVTLGCAAEKAVLLLIISFADTLTGPDKAAFQRETSTFIISRKYKCSGPGCNPWPTSSRTLWATILKA